MHILKRTCSYLFVPSAFVVSMVLAAPVIADCDVAVPLAKLIANPDAYHGKAVWVVAEATIEFENMTACPSKQASQDKYKNCLWLTIDDGPHKSEQDNARYLSKLKTFERFNLQTVAVRATFDKTLKGHFSMWPGGLRNVTEMLGHEGGWDFTTDRATPRNACVDKLQLPKQPDDQRAMISGNLKLRNKDINGAIADFSRAISISPSNGGYYLTRASARGKSRDFAGAIADYTFALTLMPEDKDSIYIFRAEMKEKNGDLDGAIADYTRAIEISPKDADTYRRRGLAKQKKGDATGAAADTEKAKQLAKTLSTP